MNKSENINELAKALSAAQIEMSGAYKDSKNPFFKSSYADLKQVMQVFQTYYAPKGLAVSQLVGLGEIETILMHESGQYISTICLLPLAKQNDPQAMGISISYMRRYALSAVLGVYQTDDDGEGAMNRKNAQNNSRIIPDQPAADDGDPNALHPYRIPFGKYKMRTLEEVGPKALADYIDYLEQQAQKKNVPIVGQVADFIESAAGYIAALENGSDWASFSNKN
jgi:hypothetical protein